MAASSKRVVLSALIGNGLIAISKFVVAAVTGSVATLAEATHSVADTGNQVLLLLGMRLSKLGPSKKHPFGRSIEAYFWPFVVSIMLFVVGGGFAIYEGVHRLASLSTLASPEAVSAQHVHWLYGVLGLSLIFEGYTFTVAYKAFSKVRGERTWGRALTDTKDPTVALVLMEDSAAMVGLLIALAGVTLTHLTGWSGFDGIASLLIGLVLCTVAVFLARETHSLLVGEAVSPADRDLVMQTLEEESVIVKVTQLLSMHRGPQDVILALKLRFAPDLAARDIYACIARVEKAIQTKLPSMKHIFIEPDAPTEP